AEGLALEGPLAEQVEGPAGLAQPAHAVVDAARPQPQLGDLEALARAADDAVPGNANVLVQDLRVPVAEALVLAGHGRDVAQPLDAGRVCRDHEHGSAL